MTIFSDVEDFVKFLRWCSSVLHSPNNSKISKERFEESKKKLSNKLKSFEAKVASGRGFPRDYEIRDFFTELKVISGINEKTTIEKRPWDNFTKDMKVYGVEPMVMWGCNSHANSTFWHEYSDKPDKIEINFHQLVQDGRRIWVGGCKAKIINAIGSVPYIDAWIENREISRTILTGEHAENQWQRSVSYDRVIGIANFLDEDNSYLANGIMIYADLDHDSVHFNKGKLTVNFDFLQKRDFGTYSDHDKSATDLRPIWIIDGQHRTRGAAMSKRGSEMELPVILCVGGGETGINGMSKSDAAKMFSEINTQSKALDDEHQLYAGDRFEIPSVKKNLDFSNTINGKKNRFSYRLAAMCCSEIKSPLYNRIRMMPKIGQYESQIIIVEITTWMSQTRKWADYWINDEEEGFKDAMNYLLAFAKTMIRGSGETLGWGFEGNRGNSLFENKGPFNSVLEIYPDVRKFTEFMNDNETRAFTEQEYMEIMKPWAVVNFTEQRVKDRLNGRHKNIEYLNAWLLTAMYSGMYSGIVSSPSEAISMSIHSKPGQGLLSAPAKPILSIETGDKTLTSPLIIVGKVPYHTKSMNAYLFFSDVKDEEGIHNLEVAIETIPPILKSKISSHHSYWNMDDPDTIQQKTWNIMIKPEDVEKFSGAVELRVQATNFIGDGEIAIEKLRD